jgi:hypothetical protein
VEERFSKGSSPLVRKRFTAKTENVHFLFASVLETAEKQKRVIGQCRAFANVVGELRPIKMIVVVADANHRAAFIKEELLQRRKSEFAVGICAVDVKCVFSM